MRNVLLRLVGLVLAIATIQASALAQGTTTSSMTGQVVDQESGETLIGATVVAIHEPSGTSYGTITNENGYYRMSNLRVGGPYRITVSYTGYGEIALEGVNLRLGETRKYDFKMASAAEQLTTIEVTASAGTAGQSAGASTQISTEAIETMPTLNRNLGDYVKLTLRPLRMVPKVERLLAVSTIGTMPFILMEPSTTTFSSLAGSGTNGGQTGIAPFSIDIIDQFQVVLSPYDVTLGGFAEVVSMQ
ncbi:MAG: carboxypeptidase-like regulatory domain-containing protein [Saprospiraceae bacterium]